MNRRKYNDIDGMLTKKKNNKKKTDLYPPEPYYCNEEKQTLQK